MTSAVRRQRGQRKNSVELQSANEAGTLLRTLFRKQTEETLARVNAGEGSGPSGEEGSISICSSCVIDGM